MLLEACRIGNLGLYAWSVEFSKLCFSRISRTHKFLMVARCIDGDVRLKFGSAFIWHSPPLPLTVLCSRMLFCFKDAFCPWGNRRRPNRSSRFAIWMLATVLPLLVQVTAYGEDVFEKELRPFLRSHCLECHSGEAPDGKLDLAKLNTLQSISDKHSIWKEMVRRVVSGNMPPKGSSTTPSDTERKQFSEIATKLRREEALRFAGDPGSISVRRLNNAEYNNSLKDLIGVDLKPAREFPVDPANEAGFDNSSESLAMSPALLNKVLGGARDVSSHMVLLPNGIAFASHPVTTDTDRDKYCVQRIVDFYQKQPTDLADYLFAAKWVASGQSEKQMPLEKIANRYRISSKYLSEVVAALSPPVANGQPGKRIGPMAEVRQRWQAIPMHDEAAARHQCELLRDFVLRVRRELEPKFNMRLKGIHDGAQAFVLWKNEQSAKHRRTFVPTTLQSLVLEKLEADVSAVLKSPEEEDSKDRFYEDLEVFCRSFPDAFFVSERGRDYLGVPKEKQEKGRLLSAGFHSMMGYFRDDQPLCDLILSDSDRLELDQLWKDLDFATYAPIRQYQGFLWFERTDHHFLREAEFDFARPENRDAVTEQNIKQLSVLYLAKAERLNASKDQLNAISDFFTSMNRQIRWVEQARLDAQQAHIGAITKIAERAFRGAFEVGHERELRKYYAHLRSSENLTHEEAIQDLFVWILMSPEFYYRTDLGLSSPDRRPLTNLELANRLSYFLWSGMPDERLMAKARSNQLRDPNVLASEVERMLRDDRVRGLAVEFGSQWLDFQRFQVHNSVDRVRFPQFTDSLREAMYQEPIRFLLDLIQQNRSVLSCIDGQHGFVNAELAKHYGLTEQRVDSDGWVRVSDFSQGISQGERGGLLPMAVFMTQNAPGLRTSPVKRGYWVVRRLLGEQIPPPPPGVPELPSDESQLGELSLRQTLERHRQLEDCAVCHDRFDAIGLAFESYGPVGERRQLDLGNKPIDDSAVFPDGSTGKGLDGLREYILRNRVADFDDNLCRKLLAFALGRTLRLSDDLLIEEMLKNLKSDDHRFGTLIKTIVLSPQFLEKRGLQNEETGNVE